MYCIKCGAKINDDALYCVKCGAKRIPDNIFDKRAAQARAAETKAENRRNEDNHGKKENNNAKKKKRIKTLIILAGIAMTIALPIVIFSVIVPFFKSVDKYDNAVSLMESGSYEQAIPLFTELGEFKDSKSKLYESVAVIKKRGYKDCNVGDILYFGDYNGITKWLVLEKRDGKALIICEEAIDVRPYNKEFTDATWETCDLRRWLNEGFYNTAFSADEKAMIEEVSLANNDNIKEETDGGNDTTDKVFLLSIDEAEKYFASDEDRMCVPTEYANANGAYTFRNDEKNGEKTTDWWLRSPGFINDYAAYIRGNGEIDSYGHSVNLFYVGVRPAMWINVG